MRSALFGSLVAMLAVGSFACSDDTPAPSGPLPGDVISADASTDDLPDAAMIDLDATSRPDTSTVSMPITDAASTTVPDAATVVDSDASIDDDF